MPAHADQHLLVDADDTLWENHALFLEVMAAFLDAMEERGHVRAAATEAVRAVERERTRTHGYGSRNFVRSLVLAQARLEGEEDASVRDRFLALGEWIHEHPIEPFPGVPATLESLSKRHRLLLVTKGNAEEQSAKVRRSGLDRHFTAVEILPEKDRPAYATLARRHGLDPARTWMIGNSPRSDINPAKAAGFRTVHIPHRTIWEFEHEEINGNADLHLSRFADLLDHF